jgi:hypothetical protein
MENQKASSEILFQLKQQFDLSERNIKIFEPDKGKIDIIKLKYNILETTLLSAVVYGTGGIVFDNWVRLLASGERDIASWNNTLCLNDYLVVADDILGGLFGLNYHSNLIDYFAPDTLEWESLDLSYSQFVQWLVEDDVDKFYEVFHWENWRSDVQKLNFSEGVAFYPFLWTNSENERAAMRLTF